MAVRNSIPDPWRWTSVFLIFWIVAVACEKETPTKRTPPAPTPSPTSQLRVVEPWLSGFATWQPCELLKAGGVSVQNVKCRVTNTPQRFVSIEAGSCDVMMKTHQDAVELLAYVPVCTDAAIEKLSALAKEKPDANILSDLAGAHLVRARRYDRPSDYVRALSAAQEALKRDASLPQARFNAALAQEGTGFPDEAIRLWRSLNGTAPAGWNVEAETHAKQLGSERGRAHAMEWRLNVDRLRHALDDANTTALEELISPFRYSAQNYVEEEVLRDWALASADGRTAEANEKLRAASRIASVLEKLNKDRYLSDAVRLLRGAHDSHTLAALQEGHVAFAKARTKQRNLASETPETFYEQAQRAFTRAGSPFRFGAMLGRITAMSQSRRFDKALKLMRAVDDASRFHSYDYLRARVHSARGYLFAVEGSHFQSLAEYTKAQAIYDRTNDVENLGNVHSRRLGAFVEIGSAEETWRQVFLARRYPSADVNARHLLLGETARLAVEMNYPAIGLSFQDAAVRFLQDELNQNKDDRLVPQLRRHLGIALRARASIRARLDDRDGARADLAQAIPLIGALPNSRDALIPIGFGARLAEAEAQTVAKSNRTSAIGLLTRAIRDVKKTHYQTLLASLLLQRAELYRLSNSHGAALDDLHDAVAVLRAEAQRMINAAREPIQSDKLWDAYFFRRQDAYRRLIRMLVEEGDAREAFDHSEEARAFEPLHALQQRTTLPPAFDSLVSGGKPLRLETVEAVLPDGTYLLEYCVLDDRTYLWIISHGKSELQTLNVGNEDIAQWAAALSRYAASRADEKFRQVLPLPYEALLKRPLERISQLHGRGTLPRVVIVPDRAMHGLPFSALGNDGHSVIENYRVSVAASATLYTFSWMQDRELARLPLESVLLLGDPAFEQGQDIARGLEQSVPGLRVNRIKDIYEPLARVKALVREDATVPQFLNFAPYGGIIHLAAHGVANPDVPSRSFFLLAPAENDAGPLDTERLLRDLRLQKTRLAVLAACSSAGGTAVGPDGLAPLVRPFIVAGVPGVVGTLWNVSAQEETEELLVWFHYYYSTGVDADDALRLAQLKMRGDPAAARSTPRAWGAFQMIGHASSPFPPRQEERRR
jgi:CHAT domain-containing protein